MRANKPETAVQSSTLLFRLASHALLHHVCVCVCVCVCVGLRSEISEADLSKFLPEEVEEEVRQAAEISMGTEVHIIILSLTSVPVYIIYVYN